MQTTLNSCAVQLPGFTEIISGWHQRKCQDVNGDIMYQVKYNNFFIMREIHALMTFR